ncbi:MAG: glycosyltransferase family 4 protein [Xylanivirga thermophila]|jgi:glycosyltransferase involved in cell wall biosynthesis|uniref:glycosyltransferase family 4 protein n=1 Tax=Xylanivirga thermophila TaxID=2496273 RepID=UPI0039F4BE1F
MKKIAFVPPWFGLKIPGGAEAACRDIAFHLKDAGVEVEILTTCVEKFASDWNVNYYRPGVEIIEGIPIKRFKVTKRDTKAFDRVNAKLIKGMPVTLEEEEIFFREMVNSEALYKYIREMQGDYDAFIFIPYMFGTTYYGVKACPEKSILIPCLHDESYAHLKGIEEIFKCSQGMVFLSRPEMELAERLYDIGDKKRQVIGVGIDTKTKGNRERFIKKYGIENPFILYAGRKDAGKNVDTLLQYFQAFLAMNPGANLDLVLIGGGSIDIPEAIKDRVWDLGFVPIEDKYDAYGAATLLCQPSHNESFSIVIMESWIEGTPVLVSAKCDVTKDFCIQSNGGLYFKNYYEFEACVNLFIKNTHIAARLGKQGKGFVEKNLSWDVVTAKYKTFIEGL